MPIAKIDRFMLRIENDLGQVASAGPAVTVVSASASSPTHHRVNPYFERPRRTQPLRVAYKLKHPNPADVRYVAGGTPALKKKKKWKGEFVVPQQRLRTNGPFRAKALLVENPPTAEVSRQIDCQFWIVSRYDHETQQWVSHPDDSLHRGDCVIDYELRP